MRRIYYSHSRLIYGTARERDEVRAIRHKLGWKNTYIVNPGEWSEGTPEQLYLKSVAYCDALVFSLNPYGHIGVGTYAEIMVALRTKVPVYFIGVRSGCSATLYRNPVVLLTTRGRSGVNYANLVECGDIVKRMTYRKKTLG